MNFGKGFPVITLDSTWNELIRLPEWSATIASKYCDKRSSFEELFASLHNGRIQFVQPCNYEYVSHSSFSLVLKHVSGLKVAFVAPTKTHNVHNKAVLSVSAAANALVVSSDEENKLLVWDSRTNEVTLDLKGHGGPINKCKFFPSGIVVISAGADGSCRIWSAESGVNPVTLKGHTMGVFDISIIEKGRNVVTVSRDGAAKLWDVGEAKCLANLVEGHGTINTCAIATTDDVVEVENEREVGTNNKVLVVGCERGEMICVHIAKREQIFCKQMKISCEACAIVENCAVVGCGDGRIIALNLTDGSIVKEWHETMSTVLCLVALTGPLFAIGRRDGTCTVQSLSDQHHATRAWLTGSNCDGIRDISFNGKWVFTACRDMNIRKYDYNQILVHFK